MPEITFNTVGEVFKTERLISPAGGNTMIRIKITVINCHVDVDGDEYIIVPGKEKIWFTIVAYHPHQQKSIRKRINAVKLLKEIRAGLFLKIKLIRRGNYNNPTEHNWKLVQAVKIDNSLLKNTLDEKILYNEDIQYRRDTRLLIKLLKL